MNRAVRIIIYIIVYTLLLQYLQLSAFYAFAQSSTPANEFLDQFYTLVKYFTGTYLILVVILDYFVNRDRNKIKQG